MTTLPVFICKCCGKPARVQVQPALVAHRPPLLQIECITPECASEYMTYTYREGDDNSQALALYSPQPLKSG